MDSYSQPRNIFHEKLQSFKKSQPFCICYFLISFDFEWFFFSPLKRFFSIQRHIKDMLRFIYSQAPMYAIGFIIIYANTRQKKKNE